MPRTRIAWLTSEGHGGARLDDGSILTVPHALPGDDIVWVQDRRRGRTVHGHLLRVETPSPERRQPTCPVDASCGGCDLSSLDAAARLRHLERTVAHTLRWEGEVSVLVPSPRVGRARITLSLEDGRVGYRGSGSHDLVPIDDCQVARPALRAALGPLRDVVASLAHPALTHVELRTDDTKVVHVFRARGALDAATIDALAPLGHVAVGGRGLHGDPVLHLEVAGLQLRAGPRAFFQVDPEANALLVGAVVEHVLDADPERVLDLYAGIGNLGLPVAARGVPVVAVEQEGSALADLRTTARHHDLQDRITTLACAAERFEPEQTPYDVAILDPPRAGAGEVFGRVLRNRPRRVVYVSCHAPSAARDLRRHGSDYRLTSVLLVDLFPATHHIETVLVLDRA